MSQPTKNLTAQEVVDRWNGAVTVGTLANWRAQGRGPAFVKLGVKVRYPLEKLEDFERKNLRASNDNSDNTERV